ncbi:CocE/NonD family hydrolase [Naasia lichenicola]|uniref:CocE/NonD family hydrolase n=2 Tax=Naasia lichenicola TaxID=2565933 RepID=A0A4S4FVD1_9MICO|nr:CocE/NonD family hydrolase [Naasia lichenicola]
MRDGIRLATDVYLPTTEVTGDGGGASAEGMSAAAADVPGDTILIRLPYDKSGQYTFIPLIAEYFMTRGYRVVAQDVRGKFRSEGETLLFVNEARDGYDTIEWITQQPWSNGRVAMWGDSYYGYTQWAAVSTQHPALKAIAPRVTGTTLGEPVHRNAGDITRGVEMGITYLYPLSYFHSQDAFFWELDPQRRPFSEQAEDAMAAIGSRSISYDQWFPRPVHLRRFPDGHPFDARPVPTLQTIGYWDNCAPQSWADVAEIEARPAWALNHFLRLEPMDHESFYLNDSVEQRVEERPEEQIRSELPRMLDAALDFFEVFVRDNGSASDIPRVSWALSGTDEVRTSASWPPAGTRELELHATIDGGLASGSAEGTDAEQIVSWTHDPADSVPSSARNAFAFLLDKPDEAPLGERDDVLTFTGQPVEQPIDLVGPVRARAQISSDGPVMDLFVRLLDVSEDGSALRIARGQRQLVDASVATNIELDLGHLGYRLAAGHRLGVQVASTDSPEFLPQPGTGEDPWSATTLRTNRQSIAIGGPDGLAITVTTLDSAFDPSDGDTP